MSSRLRFAIPSALSLLALYLALSGGTFAGAQGVPDVGGVPPGTITAFGGPTAPPGWLPADGSEVSRAQYPELFAAIGVTYGAGNGTTTFNLPDLRGRVTVAKGTASDVDTLNESDGLPVGSRKVHHRHGIGTAQAQMNVGDMKVGGSLGTGDNWDRPASMLGGAWRSGGANFNIGTMTGQVGDTSGPLDAPAYLVVNYIIKP